MNKPTDIGTNRTGVGVAPNNANQTAQGAYDGGPSPDGSFPPTYEAVLRDYLVDPRPIGTMPLPTSVKGVASSAMDLMKGKKGTVLLDKIGERLAFERTGSRLYELLIVKHALLGSWTNGPTHEMLVQIRDEERSHFRFLVDVCKELGADPTAVTPCADLAAVESLGIQKVIADPRTTLDQALHAILVAELADNAGWEILSDLASGMGREELANRFRQCAVVEVTHLEKVRGWLRSYVFDEAGATVQP